MIETITSVLIGTSVGGFFAILGIVAKHYFDVRASGTSQSQQTEISFIQRQIEELYAPLYGLIRQSKNIYRLAKQKLPCNEQGFFDHKQFNEKHREAWIFFKEQYFIGLNEQIKNLILNKLFLLEKGRIPRSFEEFFEHQVISGCLYKLWKDTRISSKEVKGHGFPQEFESDVKQTLDRLLKRNDEFMGKKV